MTMETPTPNATTETADTSASVAADAAPGGSTVPLPTQDDAVPRKRESPPAILSAEGEPELVVQTGTRVDTGGWFGKTRLWLGVCGGTLCIAAEGRRPYHERIERHLLRESCYCHVTGALLLAPAHGMRARSLRLPPQEGWRILQWIGGKDTTHA